MSSKQPSYSNLELYIADAFLRHVSDSFIQNKKRAKNQEKKSGMMFDG